MADPSSGLDLEEHARMLQEQLDEALRESEDHRLAMVESDRQRDKARAEVERLQDGIRRMARDLEAVAEEARRDRDGVDDPAVWARHFLADTRAGDLRALLDDR